MRDVSSTTGSISNGETSWEDGDISPHSEGKLFYQRLINKANSVPIIKVLNYYGIHIDANRKTTCPFPFHKGGKERTPSFSYYKETNTFYCFGCNKGSTCCDFVSLIENTTKVIAAYKILELFNSSDVVSTDRQQLADFSERFDIMMDFSRAVHEFRESHPGEEPFKFIEHVCMVYDAINLKRELDNKALRSMVDELKLWISSYI
jgi:hypothetical protein